MLSDAEVERVLVVAAHPDDVDFGAAGSIARWTAAGAEVVYCIVTDGDAGGFDPAVPRADRNPFTFPELLAEGLEAWSADELWIMGSGPDADTFVDITDTFDRKLKALRCHASQMSDPDGFETRLREWGVANAAAAGLGEGRLAEAFRVMDTR